MSTFQRLRAGVRAETWSFKFSDRGRQVCGHGYLTRGDAEDAERAARRATKAGFTDQVKALLSPRSQPCFPALGEFFAAYRAAPPGPRRADPASREANIRRLCDVLVKAGHSSPELARVDVLTGRTVYAFRAAVERAAAAEPEARRLQLYRSANSVLTQARSVFSAEFIEYYVQVAGLSLPDLSEFRAAPGFKGCKKEEYCPPGDKVVAATFASLATMETEDPNLYRACWLALGYGLRKSEIEIARAGWFVEIDGAPFLAGDELAKNRRFPRVRAQLGAWDHLRPHVAGKAPEAFVLDGSPTERTGEVFRRISTWMRGLNWQTQHHVHELRAFAGCQVAMRSPRHIYDAQTFMRHASVTTTESYYGHHLKRALDEVQLTLPAAVPFVPVVVGEK